MRTDSRPVDSEYSPALQVVHEEAPAASHRIFIFSETSLLPSTYDQPDKEGSNPRRRNLKGTSNNVHFLNNDENCKNKTNLKRLKNIISDT